MSSAPGAGTSLTLSFLDNTLETQYLESKRPQAILFSVVGHLSAAAAFVAGGHEKEMAVGLERARQSIDTKAAQSALDQLISITNK